MIVALDLLPRVVVTGNKQSGMLEIFLMNKNSKFDERSFQCSSSMTIITYEKNSMFMNVFI